MTSGTTSDSFPKISEQYRDIYVKQMSQFSSYYNVDSEFMSKFPATVEDSWNQLVVAVDAFSAAAKDAEDRRLVVWNWPVILLMLDVLLSVVFDRVRASSDKAPTILFTDDDHAYNYFLYELARLSKAVRTRNKYLTLLVALESVQAISFLDAGIRAASQEDASTDTLVRA